MVYMVVYIFIYNFPPWFFMLVAMIILWAMKCDYEKHGCLFATWMNLWYFGSLMFVLWILVRQKKSFFHFFIHVHADHQ